MKKVLLFSMSQCFSLESYQSVFCFDSIVCMLIVFIYED